MKLIALPLLFAAAALSGCSLPYLGAGEADPSGISGEMASEPGGDRSHPALESWRLSERLGPGNEAVRIPAAVIPLPSGGTALPRDGEARLAGIVRKMREDERLAVRLEGHPPVGGSSAVNLGVAEKAMQRVKARLVELRVAPRRILMSPFGAESRPSADRESGWIELHLVSPNRSARRD